MKNTILFNTIVLVALLACSSFARADLLSDILGGVYSPRTLSVHEQDSLLGNLPKQRYRLEYANRKQVFRHSFFADYTIVDTEKGTRKPLSDGPVRDAVISPNGKYIAFVKSDQNIYLHKLDFGTEVAVTNNGSPCIYSGATDWLYEEEFATTALMLFSPDSKQLAYVRLDDREVPSVSWQMMLGEGYPITITQPYPRAGEPNPKPSVHVYTIADKSTRQAQLPYNSDDDFYIPRIHWRQTAQPKKNEEPVYALAILTLNRDQTDMRVYSCNRGSLVCTPIYNEAAREAFADYSLFDSFQWLSDGRFIALTEKSGFLHPLLFSAQGIEQKDLAVPLVSLLGKDVDVTQIYGYDEATQTLYMQVATEPQCRLTYTLNLKKNTVALLGGNTGWNGLRPADNYKAALLWHESEQEPIVYSLIQLPSMKSEVVLSNDTLQQRWQAQHLPPKQFAAIPISEQVSLPATLQFPPYFDPSKTYPVVLLQYSGPASQRVTDTWRKRLDYALAEMGFVVVIADPRGTGGQGRVWRNHYYMQMGAESADQLLVAQWVAEQPWADRHNIAMAGWSYGGYEVLQCLTHQQLQADGTPLIAKGIAIAPVTSWRLYDSAYTERYMRRPQVNESGYDAADVTRNAAHLKGKLLIVHGNADDNVHVQNTWQFVEALNDAGIDYQMLIYPDDNHFLKQGNHYTHLHRQLVKFLEK